MSDQLANIYGRGWAFPLEFTRQGIRMAEGSDDVRQSLYILLSTLPFERVMREDYGCDLNQFMFANISGSLLSDIEQHIRECILRCEPRAQVIDIKFDISNMKTGVVKVEISYCLCGSLIEQKMSGRIDTLSGRIITS